ncbi:Helicase domino [Orchesella cincta]|uniref:Helicase domino n=1 Tax=Orchesella cincta TaxID=48709 RepID=A0A1D2NA67_ORCCI|nr:Helicase domino [Orchesella cincta]
MLNWEMEFKKWCPGFKILTYYGSQKERKLKRWRWTKPNAFHVCITSYKLVIQDHQSFRRKRWKYLILDEAQNIKNFKSQRWQLLLNFHSQRLLLTTPLQNNLMELWSLLHFLMQMSSHHSRIGSPTPCPEWWRGVRSTMRILYDDFTRYTEALNYSTFEYIVH